MMHFNRSENLAVGTGQVSESDAKEFRKKQRNRQSAQRARDRAKARMRWLEREVAVLTMKNQALQSENNALRSLFGEAVCDARLQSLGLKTRGDISRVNPTEADTREHASQRTPNTTPGRIQGKLRIINTDRERCLGSVDRVAVISPIARTTSESPTRKKATSQQTHKSKESTRPEPKTTATPGRLEEPRDNIIVVQNAGSRETSDGAHDDKARSESPAKKPFALPLATQYLGTGYENLLPYIYPSTYAPNWALVNLLPRPITANGIHHHLLRDCGNETQAQHTMKLLQEASVISSLMMNQPAVFKEEPTFDTTRSQGFNQGVGMPRPKVGPRFQFQKASAQKDRLTSDKKTSWKRHKMNSFESECSSQISSESDLP